MTGEAIREYARALSARYLLAGKKDKGRILDEFCEVTGHHRKVGPGRPREYEGAVVDVLRRVWEVSDCTCAKYLAPMMGEYVTRMEVHGKIELGPEVRANLLEMSAATMDRRLQP